MPIDAVLYDGLTAHRQPVRVQPAGNALRLTYDDGFQEDIARSSLKRLDSDSTSLRLGRSGAAGWRLVVPKEHERDLLELIGKEERYGRWIDRFGLLPAAGVFAAVAVAVVTIGYVAPQWLAPHVPRSWERNLGTAIVGDFGDNRCRDPNGQRALEALVERLEPGATKGDPPIRIAAIDFGLFNAAALPGGYIVVFKGAIQEIEDADALAGIVAHEIAHVRRRHVTEALLRELGIGAFIRLFAGDIGANAQQLVSLSYTRDNEAEADNDAIRMLRRARISPKPTAELFGELAAEEPEDPLFSAEFLNSHPLTKGRASKFAAAAEAAASYSPSMSERDFAALKAMCEDADE